MFRKYGLPLLALAGLVVALFVTFRGGKLIAPAAPSRPSAGSALSSLCLGSALVEASTENIAIGTQIAGIVSNIHVQVGSRVAKGDPLFTIDDRAQKAEVLVREAAVQMAEADLADAKYELQLAENLRGKSVNSQQDRETKMYAGKKRTQRWGRRARS